MPSLNRRRLTSADNPDAFVAVSVSDDQDPIGARHSNCDEPPFRDGMIWVWIGERQEIAKDRRCLLEWNPMLAAVLTGLGRVPFKIHSSILRRHSGPGKFASPYGEVGAPLKKDVTSAVKNQ